VREPKASRPHLPGYGILDAASGRGLLRWSWATKRLEKSHNYFVATTRPDGRPHLMAVWGVWAGGAFYFSTGAKSVKARNLAANPRCVVSTERADEAVIVEGIVRRVRGFRPRAPYAAAYKKKYRWALDPGLGPIFAVRPRLAFGFIEKANLFTATATRWVFED